MKSAFFVALICFAIPAAVQFAGASVSGIVTEASGARIVAATVTIVRLLNGQVDALPVLERTSWCWRSSRLAPARLRARTRAFG